MKHISNIGQSVIAAMLVALCSCSTTPSNPEKWMEWETNACVPTAISFKNGLRKSCKWSEVVLYQYVDVNDRKLKGHAIVAFMYPVGKNQLWTYDHMGSYRTHAYLNDPKVIAQLSEILRGRKNIVTEAEFIK